MKETLSTLQLKSYFDSLLKASKAQRIDTKLKYLSEGLKKIGWQKIGIFTYSDEKEISESFLDGLEESMLKEIEKFRLNPEDRQEMIKSHKKSKTFYIIWEESLKQRNVDVKSLFAKFGYSENDNPIGILVFLKTESSVVGSMHLIKADKTGWENDIDIVEIYANYAAHIIEDYHLRKQLELTKQQYKTVFENSLDAMVVIDNHMNIILCNQRFCDLVSMKEDKILRKSILEILSGEIGIFNELHKNALKGFASELTNKIRNSRKEEIPVKLFLKPQKWGSSISQVELIIEDRRSDLNLLLRARTSERSYKLIYENASEGIGLFTLGGDFISCNPSGLIQTGYTEDELVGKNFKILVEKRIKPVAEKFFKKAVRGIQFRGRAFNIIKKDGTTAALSISAAPIKSSDNEIIGVMLISRDITSEVEANKARDKSQKEFQRILENLQDIYYRCNPKGRIEYINPAIEKILGYKNPKQLIGKSLPDTLCYDKRSAYETYEKLLKETYIYNSPFPALKANGEPLYCEENAHLLFDENGEVIGWEGTIRDESRRKDVELALAESIEQFETMTRNLPLGVYRTTADPNGRIIYLNPGFAKVFGYNSVAEMQNAKPIDFYCDTDLRSDFLKILEKQGSLNAEYQMYKKNKEIIWVSDSCFAVKDENGKMKYLDGTLEDITTRKELEAELRESEKRYRLIAENVSDVIWILDLDLKYIYVSPSVKEMRGFFSEELIGKHIKESMTDSSFDIVKKIFEERMKTFASESEESQSRSINLEIEMRHRNGSSIWTEIRAVIIKDKKNNPYGVQGVTRDITARKKAEDALTEQLALLDEKVKERTRELAKTNEELIRSNRIKSEFLANISHELRSPLTSILGYTEMLQGIREFNEESAGYLGIIGAQSSHLLQLVDSLLDIAKYESGAIKLNLTKVNINEIIEQVEDHLLIKLKKAKLIVEKKLDASIKEVNLDGQKVYQIIRNLVDNSIKFSPENKRIYIESRLVENEIQVRIKDEGIGISEKHLSSIFDPFYQIDSSSTRYYEGAGLGLHLVKNFVNMHHGRIWVESERNRGTTFTVCFVTNLQQPSKVMITPKDGLKAIHISDLKKKHKILMVDDDAEIAHLVQIMLKNQYNVLTAKNGKEAVELTIDQRPDIVLMDLSMPVLDGYEATKILKGREETKSIPVIALSARAMKSEIEKALQVGCDAHLAKPFKLNELSQMIKNFLK